MNELLYTLILCAENAPEGVERIDKPSLQTWASEVKKLESALLNAKRFHRYCEDSWYSCPKAAEGCANPGAGKACDCGADEHNAAIDAALSP